MEASPRTDAAPGRRAAIMLWGLLALAFSPVLLDLAGHVRAEPWAVYPVAFLALFAREAWRAPTGAPRPTPAWILLGAGLLLELVMVRAGWPRMARPGLVAAAAGLTLLVGRPETRFALLLPWWIPVPHVLLALPHPDAAYAVALPAVRLADALGPGASFALRPGDALVARLGAPGGGDVATLPLEPADAGIPLAVVAAGFLVHAGLVRGLPPATIVLRAALAGLLAFPIQALLVGAAVALAVLGHPGAGRTGLDLSVGLATAGGLGAAWRWREGARGPAG